MYASIHTNVIWLYLLLGLAVTFLCILIVVCVRSRKMKKDLWYKLDKRTADLEQQIKTANEAVSVKSDFLSRMSHEIRTPLNAIIGMAQIARNTTEPDRVAECMEKLEESSKHLLGVINDILDFSKIESGNMLLDEKQFSLSRDMDFVISLFRERANEKGLELRLELKTIEHDCVTTDRLRLNQVLINLLANAVKFTDSGGSIVLSAEELVHLNGESAYRFVVRDNGVGIEPDQARKLFTPFTQANAGVTRLYGGTGLGLSISQSIVKMMGGEIELETAPGEGSVFRFTIRAPAVETFSNEYGDDTISVPPQKLQGKRILIVDDVEINREIVIALLDGSGAQIEVAENGKEAVDRFCASKPYHYDMILMDMLMPVMDGCTATTEIRNSERKDAQELKIIAMTANVLPEDMERAYLSGMNGYLPKPIELAALYRIMEEWL